MERKNGEVMSNIQDDIIDIIMECNEVDEMKARLRGIVVSISIMLAETENM